MDSEEDDFTYSDDSETENGGIKSKRSIPSVKLSPKENKKFIVLDAADLRDRQKDLIKETTDILTVSKDAATILLLHYHWNKEKLLEAYYSNPRSKFLLLFNISRNYGKNSC